MGAQEGIDVLLVDDEPALAEMTAEFLETEGPLAVTVETAPEAALAAMGPDTDCVVSDYEMGSTDGLDLLRAVRERYPELPFILFTGRGSEEIASDAISAGVTDYLQKETGTDQYAVLANRVENAVAHRRSAAAAAETEGRYRRLVEAAPYAIVVHDGSSVLYANDQYADLIGAPDTAAAAERDPISLVHSDDRDRVRERVRRTVADGERLDPCEFRIERPDGTVRWVESHGAPVEYNGVAATQVVFRDVTDRHRREQRLEALHGATWQLLGVEAPERIAEIAVETVVDVLDEPIAIVWAYDAEGEVLEPLAASPHARAVAREGDGPPDVVTLPSWSLEMSVFHEREFRVITDYPEHEGAVDDRLSTVLMRPLGEYGLLNVATERPRTFPDAERTHIDILCRVVTAAFESVEDDP